MSKDEQRSKKGRTGSRATPGKVPADLPDASEPMPTRYQRGKTYARSVFRKGAHDTLAAFVKGGLIAAAGIVASWVGYHYFGHHVDLKGWLSGKPIMVETGSIKKSPVIDADVVKKEVECRVRRERDIDKLVDRRKTGWGVYDKCKTDWKPGWNEKQTAEEVCAPHLVPYRQLSQEVKERQAKDECSAAGGK